MHLYTSPKTLPKSCSGEPQTTEEKEEEEEVSGRMPPTVWEQRNEEVLCTVHRKTEAQTQNRRLTRKSW